MEHVLIREWRTLHTGMEHTGICGLCMSLVLLSGCGAPSMVNTTADAWTEEPLVQQITEEESEEESEEGTSEWVVSALDETEGCSEKVELQEDSSNVDIVTETQSDITGNTDTVSVSSEAYSEDTEEEVQAPVTEEISDGSCYVDIYALQVLSMVNEAREAEGLAPLTMNATLVEAAKVRAVEITQNFSHMRPDGSSCFSAYNVPYSGAAENIAAGQWSAEWVLDSWMKSEEHRANIMDARYTQIAIVCYYQPNSPYEYYWVQLLVG